MEKGTWVVLTHPTSADVDAEFNKWYDEVHLPDVLRVPGIISASRFARDSNETDLAPYLALYEFEAESLTDVIAEVERRAGTPQMELSETLSLSEETGPRTVLYRKL